MKRILLIISLFPTLVFSQTISLTSNLEKPDYFINNKKVDLNKIYSGLNPKNIKSIDVPKSKNGEVHITLRTPVDLVTVTSLNSDSQTDLLYFVDENVIKNPSEILIDKNTIVKVKKVTDYSIDGSSETFSALKITTKSYLKNKMVSNTLSKSSHNLVLN